MKDKMTAALLAIFVGTLGVHRFYLNEKSMGITLLVLTIVGWLTCLLFIGIIPLTIAGIIAFVDFIRLLMMSEEDFNKKYNNKDSINEGTTKS